VSIENNQLRITPKAGVTGAFAVEYTASDRYSVATSAIYFQITA
jgi:hypothetical protein